ncbi:MAG: TonB-dependent receptor [Deltaproteobacteria bacterium]|nr:TonB-dependent receptor [Deltaproteobacteria bacterium]
MRYGQIGAAAVLALLFFPVVALAEEPRDAGVNAGEQPKESSGGGAGQQPETDSGGDAGQRPTEDSGVDAGEPPTEDAGVDAGQAADAGLQPNVDAADRTDVPKAKLPPDSVSSDRIDDTSAKRETPSDGQAVYEIDTAEVTGYRIRATDRTTGFAETIEFEQARKTMTTLSEVLSKLVGVQVKTMGGLGAYGAATIRGSTPNQVPVFLDGIQLNMGGFSVVNLGDFTLDTLESVEVYRGNAPLRLGTGGIGGAIVMKTRRFEKAAAEVAASYGSWDTWRAQGLYGDDIVGINTLAVVSGQHSDGDFKYYNRRGTPNNTDDDSFVRRSNNQHSAATALLKLNREFDAWDVSLMDEFYFKDQGLAGIDHMVGKSEATLESLRNAINLRVERPLNDALVLDLDLAYLILSERYDDLSGSVGTGHQDNHYWTDGVSTAAVLETELSREHVTTYRIGCRYEHYDEEALNLSEEEQQDPSYRVKTEFGAEHDWEPVDTLHIVPTLRGEVHYSHFGGGPTRALLTDFEATSVTDFFFSPSLGIKYEVVDGLTLRTNGGRYNRTPDLTELFGDRGGVVGNPDLKAEAGYNADAGATYMLIGRSFLDLLRVDAAWFTSWVEDLISFEQNSQETVRPINIDSAQIHGFELGLRVSLFELTTLSGNYTYFYGVDRSGIERFDGKELPGRPPHEFYARLDVGKTLRYWGLHGWTDVDYAGKAYVGRNNFEGFVTKHLFVGAGGRFELPRLGLSLTLEVKNLLDALVFKNDGGDWVAMSDYNRYPLPGRTFLATLHWQWL